MARRATNWWLRSPNTYNTYYVFLVSSYGDWYNYYANISYGVRPALMENEFE